MPCTREVKVALSLTLTIQEAGDLEDDAAAVVWDAGLVLAHYLIHAVQAGDLDLNGARVVELGAGTGLVGLTAAALGAAYVTLTDLPQVLPHLRHNIEANGLAKVASAQVLHWGTPLPLFDQSTRDKDQRFTGQSPVDFDLVLVSDCVYTLDRVRPLVDTMAQLLCGARHYKGDAAGDGGVRHLKGHQAGDKGRGETGGSTGEAAEEEGQQDVAAAVGRDQGRPSATGAAQQQEAQDQGPQQAQAVHGDAAATAAPAPGANTAAAGGEKSEMSEGCGAAALVACEMRPGDHLPLFHDLLHQAGLQETLVPYPDLHRDWCSPDILVWWVRPQGQPSGSRF